MGERRKICSALEQELVVTSLVNTRDTQPEVPHHDKGMEHLVHQGRVSDTSPSISVRQTCPYWTFSSTCHGPLDQRILFQVADMERRYLWLADVTAVWIELRKMHSI